MTLKRVLKNFFAATPFLLALGLSVYFFFYTTPDGLVDFIGLQNAYFLMFTLAALGGLTTFNTVPYYSILLVLATAGVNPFILGLSSALGVMTGDSFSYFVGHQGATIVPTRLRSVFTHIYSIAVKYPKIFPLVCFLYGSFSPLSNDFITIPAGMARIPYLRVMAPLALGNIVFNVALAYLALYAYDIVHSVFIG